MLYHPVAGGTVPAPEGARLGLALNRKALAYGVSAIPVPLGRTMVRDTGGASSGYARPPVSVMSNPFIPVQACWICAGRATTIRLDQDLADDDESSEFADLWERTGEGPVSQGAPGTVPVG